MVILLVPKRFFKLANSKNEATLSSHSVRSLANEPSGAMPKLRVRKVSAFGLPILTKSFRKEKGASTDPFATLQFEGKLDQFVFL